MTPLWVVLTGILVGLASPHARVPLLWIVAFVPLLLALDLTAPIYRGGWPGLRFWLPALGCTAPAGVIFAAVIGGWITNTANVYGGFPISLALLANWLGYGTFFFAEFFFFLAVPFVLTRHRPWLALVVVPLWVTVFQLYVPRFLFFTYGQLMDSVLPLPQFADILGSGGPNLLYLALQLVLFYWVRSLYAPGSFAVRPLVWTSGALVVSFAAAYGYGIWQMDRWSELQAAGKKVELVGIQPNFSLKHLSSNPVLSPLDRRQSFSALIEDSNRALSRARRDPGTPVVMVWPESVYPRAYFFNPRMRRAVEDWARRSKVELILTSQDYRFGAGKRRRRDRKLYGVSIHLGPGGKPAGIYRKMALIPLGETIPLGDWFPFFRRFVLDTLPNFSEFTAGEEFTVFTLANGVKVAPMICYDVIDHDVARGMARNGARLGVVLANLAWFGDSTVSDQMSWMVRFRAIENRMPILFLSQNGKSYLIDATGRDVIPRLGLFSRGAIVHTIGVPKTGSFYSAYGTWIHAGYFFLLLGALGAAWWRGLFSRAQNESVPPFKSDRRDGN